jgi:hypothetical protein
MGGGAATQPHDFCLQNPTAAVCSTEKAIWTSGNRASCPSKFKADTFEQADPALCWQTRGASRFGVHQSREISKPHPSYDTRPSYSSLDRTRPDTVTKRCSCGSFNPKRAHTSPAGVAASITKDPSSRRDIFGSGLASTSVSRPATRACR